MAADPGPRAAPPRTPGAPHAGAGATAAGAGVTLIGRARMLQQVRSAPLILTDLDGGRTEIPAGELDYRADDAALAGAGLRAGDLAAIGITNQRETVMIWDRASGEPLAPAIVWQDRRTAPICDRLRAGGRGGAGGRQGGPPPGAGPAPGR